MLVDDYSEDNLREVIPSLEQTLPVSFLYISLKEINEAEGVALKGKKRALQAGIDKAKGDLIVTTDADCRMGSQWLSTILSYFTNQETKMLVGPVTFYNTATFFEELQAVEFAALIGTGAVSLSLGQPNMCNGANLAFTKEAFLSVGGYEGNEHLPSGDDEFLLQKIFRMYPQSVSFNASPQGVVVTTAASGLGVFYKTEKAVEWKMEIP